MLASTYERIPWLPYVLPYAVFLLVTQIEPTAAGNAWAAALGLDVTHYPLVYTAKLVAVVVALALVWPVYRTFPFGVTLLGLLVGVVGGVAWIALCRANFEATLLPAVGLGNLLGDGDRAAYNPLDALSDNPVWMYGLLTIRFIGLALVVPIVEEFFLRGFLMRFVTATDWAKVTFGMASTAAIVVGTVFPMLTHPPGEWLSVIVWFSLVTWLMLRTRNIWDCVAAHAVTNLMLGIYVLSTGDWHLW